MPYISTSRYGRYSAEFVRSWRTGSHGYTDSHNTGEVVSDPPRRRPGESLGKYVARRNDYLAQTVDNVVNQTRFNGVSLYSDAGHRFISTKLWCNPGSAQYWHTRGGPRTNAEAVPPVPYFKTQIPHTESFLGAPRDGFRLGDSLPFAREPSYSANHRAKVAASVQGKFSSLVPGAQSMGWGETVVELAQGNFPGAFTSLMRRVQRKRLYDTKSHGGKTGPLGVGRDLGDTYLQYQFGIAPIIADFKALLEHLITLHELLYDTVKRERETPLLRSSSLESAPLSGVLNSGPIKGEYDSYSDTRLVAKFAKLRSHGRGDDFYAQAQDILFNLGVNRRLAWDLLPFSFLVDWYGHLGQSINAATKLDPLTGDFKVVYAYATTKTNHIVEVQPGSYTYRAGHGAAWSYASAGSTCLEREPISPFGPKFAFSALTSYQWSILVALGFAVRK